MVDSDGTTKRRLFALECACKRCAHSWMVAGTPTAYPERPTSCARCKSRNWWEPVGSGVFRRGRPPKPKRARKGSEWLAQAVSRERKP